MKIANRNKLINVTVKGYKITCVNRNHEIYDFFMASDLSRLPKYKVEPYINEQDTIIEITRHKEIYPIKLNQIIENN